MSNNIKWAYQKKFEKGEIILHTGLMLGYEKSGTDSDGKATYKVVESEAAIIRRIYREYLKASVKYKVIYRHIEKYSISEICRFFGVSRSGYYSYVKRMDIPSKDMPLAKQIRACQAECRSTYGYRRVHIWLERKGVHYNPKTVLRVMNKYNLLSVVRRKRYVKYGEALHRYPNLLNRNFAAERPSERHNIQNNDSIKQGREKQNKYQTRYRNLVHSQLIIIDDMMYARIADKDLPKIYHALTFLNEERSLIIVTNRELSAWAEGAEDEHMVNTLVSRLAAGSQIIRLP